MLTSCYLQSTTRIRAFAYANPFYYQFVRWCIHIGLKVLPTKQKQKDIVMFLLLWISKEYREILASTSV